MKLKIKAGQVWSYDGYISESRAIILHIDERLCNDPNVFVLIENVSINKAKSIDTIGVYKYSALKRSLKKLLSSKVSLKKEVYKYLMKKCEIIDIKICHNQFEAFDKTIRETLDLLTDKMESYDDM